MERMEGVDAGYLYLETPSMHMHTLKVAIIESPTDEEGFGLARLERELMARIDALPPLRRRVLPVPWWLHHPVWVQDRPVDPARHLHHHRLPPGGGMADLERLIGEIAGTPLDRSLPLWEMHAVEGLTGDRVAIVTKMHHALADGVAANSLLAGVTDQADPSALRTASALEPTPTRMSLLRAALLDGARQALELPALVWRTARAVTAVLRRRRHAEVAVPRPILDVPRVSFNGPLTPRRGFATTSLPLADVKEVRRRHDVTVNDVVLAVVAGALRRWLDERGERLRASLVAGVPVATDAPGAEPRLGGNRVSNLFTSLATDVDDPLERLLLISRTTAESKVVQRTLGPEMLLDWVQFTPPGPMTAAMRAYSRLRAASYHRAPFNVVVSNVPGPREPVTIAGARLVDLFSVGPILEGIGLNVTVWSYVDRLNFSLLSCPDLLPDLRPVADQLRPALDELLEATEPGWRRSPRGSH